MTEYFELDDGSPSFGSSQARIAILLADHKQYKMLGPHSGDHLKIVTDVMEVVTPSAAACIACNSYVAVIILFSLNL